MPDAILLAGGEEEGSPSKAFLDGAGRPLVWYVAQALAATPAVGRVGPWVLQINCGPPAAHWWAIS
jgi:GTP:adenosylcobinamide-phosphate guanylyltransferase